MAHSSRIPSSQRPMLSRRPSVTALLVAAGAAFTPIAVLAETPATPPASASQAAPATPAAKPDTAGKADQRAQADAKDRAETKAELDARLAGLHAGLELTSAQAGLWQPVEDAIRALQTKRDAMRDGGADDHGPLARLKRRGDWMMARGKAVAALADATKPLIAALDTDQKDRLPRLLEGMPGERLLRQAFDLQAEDREAGWDHGDRFEHHADNRDRYDRYDGGDDRDGGWRDHQPEEHHWHRYGSDEEGYDRRDERHAWRDRDGDHGGDRGWDRDEEAHGPAHPGADMHHHRYGEDDERT